IVVSLRDEGTYGGLLAAAGIECHALGMPRGRVTAAGVAKLLRLIRRSRPDVVQTWMYHANLVGGVAARACGVRKVIWGLRHTDLAPGSIGGSTRLVNRACAVLSGVVPSVIVACAQRAAEVHEAAGYDRRKLVVIPNGYDLSRFAPDGAAGLAVRAELGIPAGAPVLGLVARFNPQKNHAGLLEAVARLRSSHPDLQVILAGRDCSADNSVLADMAARTGVPVHLIGPRRDVPAVMNALDLHVLASGSGEAFPNVVAEAMACGTPCVVTDVGDAARIVGDTGWVAPVGDSIALENAILAALAERRDAAAWGRRKQDARARVASHFSLQRMVSAYAALWEPAAAPRFGAGL
ncbi:MAG TPA: glycosyltransferase, partial [Rhizomicrobium sp.]|nr:glycosyltransferase [Rhizomicrobium sp.]